MHLQASIDTRMCMTEVRTCTVHGHVHIYVDVNRENVVGVGYRGGFPDQDKCGKGPGLIGHE